MTIHAQTLTNPGAEAGSLTGWTIRSGTPVVGGAGAHSGSFYFRGGTSSVSAFDQDLTVDPSLHVAVDAGTAIARLSAYHSGFSGDSDGGYLIIRAYDAGMVLLDEYETGSLAPDTWTLEEVFFVLPANTRTIRFGVENFRSSGSSLDSYWDDFTLDISDDGFVDYGPEIAPRVHQYGAQALISSDVDIIANQLGVYGLVSAPAEEVYVSQFPINALVASETSNGLYEVYSHQLGAYALVRPHGDRRQLRAWKFKQDDHEFWGVNLGTVKTLVYDKLTQTWSQWRFPGDTHWRVEDVTDWEGFNIASDTDSGILWEIDAAGRLDLGTTPITSIVYGGYTKRMRANDPCYMAELAISEGEPPTGVDATTLGITLRTSDDSGQSFVNHGEIEGEAIGDAITVRWYGLGLMDKPGRIFEITDTGYARRLDALDIEVGQK